jgi:transposase
MTLVCAVSTGAVPMSGYSQEKTYAVVAETRRRWSEAERKQIVAETEAASVSSVARKHRVAASLVFRWRRAAGVIAKSVGKEASAFVRAMLAAPSPTAVVASPSTDRGKIEIELAGGRRLRVGPVDVATLKQVIAVLEGR